jgi:chromate transport protein ChrA
MDNLSLGIFVIPIITLTLIIILYVHFFRKVDNKRKYQHFIVNTAVAAFILNLVWELAQGPLYEGFQYDLKHISFCALASVADMLMVLVLLFAFALIYKNAFWIRPLKFNRSLLLTLVGGLGAIAAEIWHIWRGDWSYADSMPMLPIFDVGLSPVLQFAILPLAVFVIGRKVLESE